MILFFFFLQILLLQNFQIFPKDMYCELNVFLISHPQLCQSIVQVMLADSYLESCSRRVVSGRWFHLGSEVMLGFLTESQEVKISF